METLLRQVLRHFSSSDERAMMVLGFRGSFWNRAGEERSNFLCGMWQIYSDNCDCDADLARELLLLPLTSRPLFDETLDRINREMSIATTSGEELIDPGSLSAPVPNTPLGDPEQHTTDDDTVAAPSPADDDRAVAITPGQAQDLEDATLGPDPCVTNLAALPNPPAAAVPPTSQPASPLPAAAAPPDHSSAAAASTPVALAVSLVRVKSSHWDCCRIS